MQEEGNSRDRGTEMKAIVRTWTAFMAAAIIALGAGTAVAGASDAPTGSAATEPVPTTQPVPTTAPSADPVPAVDPATPAPAPAPDPAPPADPAPIAAQVGGP